LITSGKTEAGLLIGIDQAEKKQHKDAAKRRSFMSLSGAMYTSSTALGAFGVGTQVIAHNLANVLTDGFKSSRTMYYDLPPYSGTGATTQKLGNIDGPLIPAQGLPPQPGSPPWVPQGFVEGSNTDIATEMVSLIVTSRAYQANAKVVPTVDSMLGTIINLRA
jgi:flagellar basal body rod protein FlgG